MKIINGLKRLRHLGSGSVVTIGVFDGVHVGHRYIIRKAVQAARQLGLKSVVVTFDPHPAKVLGRGPAVPSLISLKHRIKLIEGLGADILLVLKFTKPFSKMPPENFLKNILIDKLGMKRIYAGGDFYFGRGAGSGAAALRKLSSRYDFRTVIIRPIRVAGHTVSSSRIRRSITKGRLSEAARLLGRPVSVLGTVVKGSGIARGLGCPTANINPHHEVIPPGGVYAVGARFDRKALRGVVNIGFRPTFYGSRDEEPTVEVHFFGFSGNLYNRDIEVYFVKKLRDEFKFTSKNALVRQIKKDMRKARSALSA